VKLAVHDWIHPEPIAAAIERLARRWDHRTPSGVGVWSRFGSAKSTRRRSESVSRSSRSTAYFVNRCDQALALAAEVGGDCGVCLDLFHMNIEETSRKDAIAVAAGRIADVHVADNNRRPSGEGSIGWLDVLRELAAGYDSYLTLEFVTPVDRTPLAPSPERSFDEAVRSSSAFLRDCMAELAAEAPAGPTAL